MKEFVSDLFPEKSGKSRIGLIKPSSVSDTVGNVFEFSRSIGIFVVENIVLDNFRVKL